MNRLLVSCCLIALFFWQFAAVFWQFANSGDVLSVNTLLSGNRFTGRIPQETSNLTRLFLLSLAYVPVLKMGAYIPQEISNLTRLYAEFGIKLKEKHSDVQVGI